MGMYKYDMSHGFEEYQLPTENERKDEKGRNEERERKKEREKEAKSKQKSMDYVRSYSVPIFTIFPILNLEGLRRELQSLQSKV